MKVLQLVLIQKKPSFLIASFDFKYEDNFIISNKIVRISHRFRFGRKI